MTDKKLVLTTCGSIEEGRTIGRALVEKKLAACVNIVPQIESVYRWQGKVEDSTETMLLIKTGAEQLAALEARILALHSYETPEFLVLGVDAGSAGYLDWLMASLSKA